jgi:transcriptional regulator with XRE-family HTH domain
MRGITADTSSMRIRGSVAKAGWYGPTPERLRLAAQVRSLRESGLTVSDVGAALGISRSYASELERDPTGRKARDRKDSYAAPCVECGAPTSGSEGRRKRPLCEKCAHAEATEASRIWTRERLIESIQWWARIYGDAPAMPDFYPSMCRRMGDEHRARRAERHIREGYIPWFMSVVQVFGSWNAAIESAGFQPRARYGTVENNARRRVRPRG